jgi:hypothetical protein
MTDKTLIWLYIAAPELWASHIRPFQNTGLSLANKAGSLLAGAGFGGAGVHEAYSAVTGMLNFSK